MRNRTHHYDGHVLRRHDTSLISEKSNETIGLEPEHPIRHERHRSKPKDFFLHKLKNSTNANNRTFGASNKTNDSMLFTVPPPISDSNLEISVFKLEQHNNCFNSNEVLEIIGATCLVNFAFWFLIIACVNFYTRGQNLFKSDSCDFLLANENSHFGGHVCDVHHHRSPSQDALLLPRLCSPGEESHYLQKYFEFSPGADPGDEGSPFEVTSLHHVVKERSRRLSNILNEIISMDNLRPNYGKVSPDLRRTSYSMENLIF